MTNFERETALEEGVNDLARRTHTADVMIDRVLEGLRSFKDMPVEDALRLAAADIDALVDLVADSAILARKLREQYYGGEAA